MVDQSIARLLEYALMPRLRPGLIAVACMAGAWSTALRADPAPAAVPVAPRAANVERFQSPVVPTAGDAARSFAQQSEAGRQNPRPDTHDQGTFPEEKTEPAPIDDLLTIPVPETVPPKPATTEAVAEDLSANPPGIDIPLNPKVLSYVELFSGRLKGYLEDGLNRGAQYLPMIQDVFRSEGVPLDLAYVPLVESAFKPNAVSRAQAKGMWQFMHGTALENGLRHDWYIDERADPEKATRAAARYLKTLYGMFGDWNLALASYNGGPGRIQRAMKRSGKDDFWDISKHRKYLPQETRDYVPLILAAVTIARNPEQYGMTVGDPRVAPPVERVAVSAAVDLRRIAEWTGVPVQTIQELNPELRRWTTPVRGAEYELKVPYGLGDAVRVHLTEIDGTAPPLSHYIAPKNETLSAVARRLGVTRTDLAEANYLSVKTTVRSGQSLIIPRPPAYAATIDANGDGVAEAVTASLALSESAHAFDSGSSSKTTAHAKATSGTRKATSVKVVHRVKAGETLTSIAENYNTTVAALKQSNHLHSNTIRTGQRLSVIVARSTATD
jgi:membrane-bound lytic murein transglycosylase D